MCFVVQRKPRHYMFVFSGTIFESLGGSCEFCSWRLLIIPSHSQVKREPIEGIQEEVFQPRCVRQSSVFSFFLTGPFSWSFLFFRFLMLVFCGTICSWCSVQELVLSYCVFVFWNLHPLVCGSYVVWYLWMIVADLFLCLLHFRLQCYFCCGHFD